MVDPMNKQKLDFLMETLRRDLKQVSFDVDSYLNSRKWNKKDTAVLDAIDQLCTYLRKADPHGWTYNIDMFLDYKINKAEKRKGRIETKAFENLKKGETTIMKLVWKEINPYRYVNHIGIYTAITNICVLMIAHDVKSHVYSIVILSNQEQTPNEEIILNDYDYTEIRSKYQVPYTSDKDMLNSAIRFFNKWLQEINNIGCLNELD